MQLTNSEINIHNKALSDFLADETIIIPIKINFHIMQNANKIQQAWDNIEQAKMILIEKYGVLNEEELKYYFTPENAKIFNSEVNNLMSITQEVPIVAIKLETFGNIELTPKQMQALMFMIEE